jgi:hypothetical protein
MTNGLSDRRARLNASRAAALALAARPDPGPAYLKQCEVNAWRQQKQLRLDEIDTLAGPRTLRDALAGAHARIDKLEAHAAMIRALRWDGEGTPPPIPPLPVRSFNDVTGDRIKPATRNVEVDGKQYVVAPADALKLSGAFLVALNSGETSVQLESGEILVVTPANATAIAEQLAGG